MRYALAVLAVVAYAVEAQTNEWPQRFLQVAGTDHTLVVLHEDGTAAFSTRRAWEGYSDYYFVATRATWRWCDPPNEDESGRKCLHLFVDGYDGHEAAFRFDYWYELARMTEFDKMGVQRVLMRRSEY